MPYTNPFEKPEGWTSTEVAAVFQEREEAKQKAVQDKEKAAQEAAQADKDADQAFKDATLTAFKNKEAELQAMSDELAEWKASYETQGAQLSAANAQIKEISKDKDVLKKKHEVLYANLGEAFTKVKSLEQEVDAVKKEAKQEVDAVQKKAEQELAAAKKKAEQELAAVKQDVATANKKADDKNKRATTYLKELIKVEQAVKDNMENLSHRKIEIPVLIKYQAELAALERE